MFTAGKPTYCFAIRLLALSLAASVSLAFGADSAAILRIECAGKPQLALSVDDLAKMSRKSASMDRDGEVANYEGVLLYDIVQKACGAVAGKPLPLNSKVSYILGTGRDGYHALFAMGEIAPMFQGAQMIVADKRNGGPLLAWQQPFQLIVPQDKAHGRAMFSLVKIEIVELKP